MMRRALLLSVALHLAVGGALLVWLERAPEAPTQDALTRAPVDVEMLKLGEKPDVGQDHPALKKNAPVLKENEPAPVTATSSPAPLDAPLSPTATQAETQTQSGSGSGSRVTLTGAEGTRVLSPEEYRDWVRAHNPAPEYPRLANLRHEQGRVVVRATIARRGSPPQLLEVGQGSGHELLDRAALEAVRGWHFPPFESQSPVIVLVIPFQFGLEDQ